MDNLAALFAQHLPAPEKVLYRHFQDGAWADVSVREIAALAGRWQEAFRRHGFVAGDRVAICVKNGIAWVALDLAALGAGLVVVPLYVDDNAQNIAYCIQNSGARLVVVENERMRGALERAGVTAAGIVVQRPEAADDPRAVDRVLDHAPHAFTVAATSRDRLATICYTSGTSGRPKGVMLSHGNILANVESILRLRIAQPSDEFLSFLPLSHMFERTGGYYMPLAVGAKVIYARSITLLAEDLAEQRPTAVFAVPRVFDKFAQRIEAAVAASELKRALFTQCVERGYRVERGVGSLLDRVATPVLRRIVARPILARLGGRMRLAVLGGAAVESRIPRLFMGLGLPILQGYGMTEAAPVLSVNLLWNNDPESVGPALPGIEIKLGEHDEIVAKGPNVMLGYWNDDEATRKVIDAEGWLHTGDLGEIRDGRIYIRGRLKDVLVLSNGEKLPPQDVELALLGDGAFEQLVLIGEGRPFLTLVAVTKEADEKAIVKRANERLKAFPRYVRVRRAIATPEPWTIENGLLTPTLKIKREQVARKFAREIDTVYASVAGGGGD